MIEPPTAGRPTVPSVTEFVREKRDNEARDQFERLIADGERARLLPRAWVLRKSLSADGLLDRDAFLDKLLDECQQFLAPSDQSDFKDNLKKALRASQSTPAALHSPEIVIAVDRALDALVGRYYPGAMVRWRSRDLLVESLEAGLRGLERLESVDESLVLSVHSEDEGENASDITAALFAGKKNIHVLPDEAYGEKELTVAALIGYAREKGHSICAIDCPRHTQAEVVNTISSFTTELEDQQHEGPRLFIFADLDLHPDHARRLITDQNYLELISGLAEKSQNRIMVTCELADRRDAAQQAVLKGLFGGRARIHRPGEQPDYRSVLTLIYGHLTRDDARSMGDRGQRASGLLLALCAIIARIDTGQRDVVERLLALPDPAAAMTAARTHIFRCLTAAEREVLRYACIADDGIRHSSLARCSTIASLGGMPARLEHLLGRLFKKGEEGPWADDDAPQPKGHSKEALYRVDRPLRRALLSMFEEHDADATRVAQRKIAQLAREQSHRRRMKADGVYGATLPQLARDVQCVLALLASINPAQIAPRALLLEQNEPLPRRISQAEMELRVFSPDCEATAVLRYAYLQIYRQDIDYDYRLHTHHDADELRLNILGALTMSLGQSHWPDRVAPPSPQIIETLGLAFAPSEIVEVLTSLAMSGLRVGAFDLVRGATKFADELEKQVSIESLSKLWRANIDASVLLCKGDGASALTPLEQVYVQTRNQATRLGDVNTKESQRGYAKLLLREGEIAHLMGRHRDARRAFDLAENIEIELEARTGGEFFSRRTVISGHGARRAFRYFVNHAQEVALREAGLLERRVTTAEQQLNRARHIQRLSLRRLSRYPGSRAALVLDEARLCLATALLGRARGDDSFRRCIEEALEWVGLAEGHYRDPSVSVGTRIEISAVTARVCLQLIRHGDLSSEDKKKTRDRALQSVFRLREIAGRLAFPTYQVYATLLGHGLGGSEVSDDYSLDALRIAQKDAHALGLGLYEAEIAAEIAKAEASL